MFMTMELGSRLQPTVVYANKWVVRTLPPRLVGSFVECEIWFPHCRSVVIRPLR
jgi:hypothetical protein